MEDDCEPGSIEDVLDCVEEAGEGERRVTVADIVAQIGEGAFAPLMLVPALVIVSPASAIFGVASVCAAMIALVAFQMAVGRRRLWLPGFILHITLSQRRVHRIVGWLTRPAQVLDGLTRQRLAVLVAEPVDRFWAVLCLLLALVIPAFELVPMSATIIACAISLFGLGMVARDGLFVLLGLAVLSGAGWLLWSLLTAG